MGKEDGKITFQPLPSESGDKNNICLKQRECKNRDHNNILFRLPQLYPSVNMEEQELTGFTSETHYKLLLITGQRQQQVQCSYTYWSQ